MPLDDWAGLPGWDGVRQVWMVELLYAAVELVSPRNKDRLSAQTAYTADYAGYLLRGVHLLLVDVHRRPAEFSFADQIAAALGTRKPDLPAPFAVAYRVGGPAPAGGRFLASWRRPLAVGEPLPTTRHLALGRRVRPGRPGHHLPPGGRGGVPGLTRPSPTGPRPVRGPPH